MTATAAYSATMPELRGDPAPSSLWPNYGGPVHMSPRMGHAMEPGLANPHPASPHSARPRSQQAGMDHQAYPYPRYPHEDAEPYGGHGASAIGYQNTLKRPFSQTEPPPNAEMVRDLRDDGSGVTVNQDHKLLAFRRSQDKHTITDQHGRLQQLELSAQLHGMFFLSEMPSGAGDGTALQPELTCYRRNLFQISGSIVTPRGTMSVITDNGESVPISSMEVTVSAIESVDGNPVRLIVIPWKTPPPNSPEISQSPDQEPPALPLIPFQDDGSEADGEYAVYPIGWRRLQFRIATANNGRRKELQQHFVLHLKVHGTLANNSKVVLTESTTAPIVVRGRSPRNFQARKEIPLLGSSAGSRGQALVETGLGVVAGTLSMKQQEGKPRSMDMQVPRSGFTFNAPKPPGHPMTPMRSNTYPTWNSPGHGPLPQVPSSSPGSYPTSTMAGDLYTKVPLSGSGNFSAEPPDMPIQSSMPQSVPLSLIAEEQHQQQMRPQYTYVPSSTAPRQMPMPSPQSGPEGAHNVPRYVDDGRPSKTPRNAGHQPVPSPTSVANSEAPSDSRYGSYAPVSHGAGEVIPPNYGPDASGPHTTGQRDVYPPSHGWRTTTGEPNSTVSYAGNGGQPYPSSYEQYKNRPGDAQAAGEQGQAGHPAPYGGGHRGSFDAMNNYSWGSG